MIPHTYGCYSIKSFTPSLYFRAIPLKAATNFLFNSPVWSGFCLFYAIVHNFNVCAFAMNNGTSQINLITSTGRSFASSTYWKHVKFMRIHNWTIKCLSLLNYVIVLYLHLLWLLFGLSWASIKSSMTVFCVCARVFFSLLFQFEWMMFFRFFFSCSLKCFRKMIVLEKWNEIKKEIPKLTFASLKWAGTVHLYYT